MPTPRPTETERSSFVAAGFGAAFSRFKKYLMTIQAPPATVARPPPIQLSRARLSALLMNSMTLSMAQLPRSRVARYYHTRLSGLRPVGR
jgi:hypothetical protein